MERRRKPGNVWAVVLAAGEGSRMAPLTRALYGHELPKQFAALLGERTMIQRTMDRIASVAPPERTVVVVSESYADLAREQLAEFQGVEIVVQPMNLGTGPGILLPLAHVRARDPEAEVAIFPSDHHVRRPEPFVDAVRRALTMAGKSSSGVALLGAAAERPAVDLGWIVRGPRLGSEADRAFEVHRFIEKPPEAMAMMLLGAGSLWNTMVIAGRLESMWRMARSHIPHQTGLFDRYVQHVTRADAAEVRDRMYREMMPADFSREVLQVARGLAVVPVIDSGWFDCGTPERLIEWLKSTPENAAQLVRLQHAMRARKAASSVAIAAA